MEKGILSCRQFQRDTNHYNVLGPGPYSSVLLEEKKVFGSDDKTSGSGYSNRRDRQSMVLRRCIAFHIMYQPLENQMMQWTAHDYMKSKGWWDQHTLLHIFSKSYLVTGPPQPTLLHIAEGDKVSVVHIKKYAGINSLGHCCLRQRQTHAWLCFSTHGFALPQGPGCTSCVMWEDGEAQCTGQGDLILGESKKLTKLHDVNCYIMLI